MWFPDNLDCAFDPKQLNGVDNSEYASIWWQNWYNVADKLDNAENAIGFAPTNGTNDINNSNIVNRTGMLDMT